MLNRSLLIMVTIALLLTGKTALPVPLQSKNEQDPFLPVPFLERIDIIDEEKAATQKKPCPSDQAIIPIPEPTPLNETFPEKQEPPIMVLSDREERQPPSAPPVLPIDIGDSHLAPEISSEPPFSFLLLGHRQFQTEMIMVVSLSGETATFK